MKEVVEGLGKRETSIRRRKCGRKREGEGVRETSRNITGKKETNEQWERLKGRKM